MGWCFSVRDTATTRKQYLALSKKLTVLYAIEMSVF